MTNEKKGGAGQTGVNGRKTHKRPRPKSDPGPFPAAKLEQGGIMLVERRPSPDPRFRRKNGPGTTHDQLLQTNCRYSSQFKDGNLPWNPTIWNGSKAWFGLGIASFPMKVK